MDLSVKPTLIITDVVLNQIKILCDRWPNLEWSGILFLGVEGDTADIGKMIFKAKYIHLMDVGTSTYTEYGADESIIDLFEAHPELMEKKQGHIHSHNKMGTFFSGTDDDELKTTSMNYNYYVSLIVNNALDYTAKVAFPAVVEGKTFYKNNLGVLTAVKDSKEEFLSVASMNIQLEASSFFVDRLDIVIAQKKKKEEESLKRSFTPYTQFQQNYYPNTGSNYYNQYAYNGYNNTVTHHETPTPKRLTEDEAVAAFSVNTTTLTKCLLLKTKTITPENVEKSLIDVVADVQKQFIKRPADMDREHSAWIWDNIGDIIRSVFTKPMTNSEAKEFLEDLRDKIHALGQGITNWLFRVLGEIALFLSDEVRKGRKDDILYITKEDRKSACAL